MVSHAPNDLEDLVLRDTLIILATSPYWLSVFGWCVVAGWLEGRKA